MMFWFLVVVLAVGAVFWVVVLLYFALCLFLWLLAFDGWCFANCFVLILGVWGTLCGCWFVSWYAGVFAMLLAFVSCYIVCRGRGWWLLCLAGGFGH